MTVKFDRSAYSIVAWCTLCPPWSRLVGDDMHGHDEAVAHEAAVHPGMTAASAARANYTRTHIM